MSTREITGHLHDLYGIDVSPDPISTVTDAVLDEVATWQQRPLDPVFPSDDAYQAALPDLEPVGKRVEDAAT